VDRRHHYYPLAWPFLAGLVILLAAVAALVQVGVLSYAYERLGISSSAVFAILVLELLGSSINLPLGWLRSEPGDDPRQVVVFGVVYTVPARTRPRATLVAVNVGGAVIPTALAAYVAGRSGIALEALAATVIVTAGVHVLARPVPGLGIAVPTLAPSLIAAAAAIAIASPAHAAAVAYCAGTVGTLLGADVLNLRRIPSLGAPMASIGGAGTFDAVFITGIGAVLLVALA
jgi:uncharacterized membrane protein